VPTFEELGFKGFDGVQWYGIVGPANMPPAIVTTLNTEIGKMLADPVVLGTTVRRGAAADADDAGAVRQYMRDDIAKWSKVAKERGIELTD
jgi:tripartite-type tricarboxylate transporter receptor subunit TctC